MAFRFRTGAKRLFGLELAVGCLESSRFAAVLNLQKPLAEIYLNVGHYLLP